MRLASQLTLLAERPDTEEFGRFRASIDPALIDQALEWTGTATIRKRRLPASQVVWLVIGMALLRNRPIRDVLDRLDLVAGDKPLVAPSSIAEARARLGEEPMLWLFARTANMWAHASADRARWKGLALYGVDGTKLLVPDTPENAAHFGRSQSKHGQSAYPMLRMAALMALRSHMLASAAFGPYARSEHYLAAELWSAVPDNSLTIVDRGFFAASILLKLQEGGRNRHWLIRAKSNARMRVIEKLGPGDELVEMEVSSHARAQDPSLPATWTARCITYQRKGFQPSRLLTSLMDATRYPSAEIAEVYHQRWELELAYDELKTEMGASCVLRSKSPERVNQEMWGLLQAYNLVRHEMEQIADELDVPPTRISFATVFNMICDEWQWLVGTATPGAIPKQLRRLRDDVRRVVLPDRRARAYPRAVKTKTGSQYPRKRA
jgi:hypothetical protein